MLLAGSCNTTHTSSDVSVYHLYNAINWWFDVRHTVLTSVTHCHFRVSESCDVFWAPLWRHILSCHRHRLGRKRWRLLINKVSLAVVWLSSVDSFSGIWSRAGKGGFYRKKYNMIKEYVYKERMIPALFSVNYMHYFKLDSKRASSYRWQRGSFILEGSDPQGPSPLKHLGQFTLSHYIKFQLSLLKTCHSQQTVRGLGLLWPVVMMRVTTPNLGGFGSCRIYFHLVGPCIPDLEAKLHVKSQNCLFMINFWSFCQKMWPCIASE